MELEYYDYKQNLNSKVKLKLNENTELLFNHS